MATIEHENRSFGSEDTVQLEECLLSPRFNSQDCIKNGHTPVTSAPNQKVEAGELEV